MIHSALTEGLVDNLTTRKCKPCAGGASPLKLEEVENLLKHLEGWALEDGKIAKQYSFKNHYQALAFVNAAAWISHREDHHPDMLLGYNTCHVSYKTHAIDGLSENDFICAAKLDALFSL
jgi:4a-hydroxytetrahydrobiopterin dehydratase